MKTREQQNRTRSFINLARLICPTPITTLLPWQTLTVMDLMICCLDAGAEVWPTIEITEMDLKLISETLLELPRGSNAAPALADLDNDGDFDLILGSSGGRVHYYRNEGSASEPDFQLVDDAFPGVEVQHRSVPALYDFDGDGDLDLFLGSKVDGIVYFENIGTAAEPEFQQADLPVALHVGQFSAPHITDLDNDGRPEFLIGNREGGILFFSSQ